jgi:N4-(beta-N-acetylglucosaminyl)-L-asparaginase
MKTIASHNGLLATRQAWRQLRQGASALDACVEGVTCVEDDPEELTVGYGGLPNEAGIVELDAAVMDGATHRGGAVAALRDFRHPTRVARLVMEQTRRVLLVGEGAREFALANGFQPENLLTDRARRMWLYWKRRRSAHDDWLAPPEDEDLELQAWFDRHFFRPVRSDAPERSFPSGGSENNRLGDKQGGTVHCAALDSFGNLACATSTSGHAFKMPGRVGDSPVLGAGLYVDNEVGSCGSIGHGEANLRHLSSFLAVELMRTGHAPTEAGLEVLRRIADKTPPEQRDAQGRPNFHLQLFLLRRDGVHAGVSLRSGRQLAVIDDQGERLEACTPLYPELVSGN